MDIATLAALAGSTLVTAAVTDAWEDVRHKVVGWFGRGKPDRSIEKRLDTTRQYLIAADPASLPRVRETEAAAWQTRFADELADHPDAAGKLEALIGEISVIAAGHSAAAGRDMTARADHGGFAANVMHGDVTVGPTTPHPASSI